MDLGKTIASLRAQKGWTQLDLAKKLNVSDKTISKWENGGGYPEITQLPVLASIFNVSIDYLMTGKEPNVEIKVVSKIEDIIMNDDVDEFIKISDDLLTVKDIDGLFAFEYLYKYYSPKIALEYEKRKLDFRNANFGEKERNVSNIICWLYGINIGDSVAALPNSLINEILSKYEIMPLDIKIRVLKHVHYSFIEYVINKSKYKDEIVELFIEHNPTINEKETFSFLVENNFLNIILKYYKASDFNIDLVCKYKDYFQNEEGTKQALRDGWAYTGDLGYLDEDNFLYYKSRLKRVIKVSGVGVFPSEIENLVCHIPGIKAVCAIEIPDAKLQHGVKLFVIADYFDEEGMRNQIMDTCKKYLIRWAMPREIEFVKELPKTLIGKIDYKKVQAEENARREGKI